MNILELFADDVSEFQKQELFIFGYRYQQQWNEFQEYFTMIFTNNKFNSEQELQCLCQDIYINSYSLKQTIIQTYFEKLDQYIEFNFYQIQAKDDFYFPYFQKINDFNFNQFKFLRVLQKSFQDDSLIDQYMKLMENRIFQNEQVLQIIQNFFTQQYEIYKSHLISIHSNTIDQDFIQIYQNQDHKFSQKEFNDILQLCISLNNFSQIKEILFNIFQIDLHNYSEYLSNKQDKLEFETLAQYLKYYQTFVKNFIQQFLQQLFQIEQQLIIYQTRQMLDQKYFEQLQTLDEDVSVSIYKLFIQEIKTIILDLILMFPDSSKVIFEIKAALGQQSNLIFELGQSLQTQITSRLLIPGVMTQYIILQYINTLKVMQIIDSDGLIFEQVTNPIRTFLLKRSDTLRSIIYHLTEDNINYQQMTRETVKIPTRNELQEISSDEDEQEAEKWNVQSQYIKKTNDLVSIQYRESDLVSVLVNLYGSQEAFLEQYQSMLGEKILGFKDYDISEEIKNLENLKIRFGENNLQNCNIILKDVKDSKRVNQNINNQKKQNQNQPFENLNVLFVSRGYWPINYEHQSFQNPTQLQNQLDKYLHQFQQQKQMRKLLWHNNLGCIDLALTFDNGRFEFKCQPIHALLINYFDDEKLQGQNVTSQQIANDLKISQNIVQQKMTFWIQKKIITEFKIAKYKNGIEIDKFIINYKANQIYEPSNYDENDIKSEDDDDNEIIFNQDYLNKQNPQGLQLQVILLNLGD